MFLFQKCAASGPSYQCLQATDLDALLFSEQTFISQTSKCLANEKRHSRWPSHTKSKNDTGLFLRFVQRLFNLKGVYFQKSLEYNTTCHNDIAAHKYRYSCGQQRYLMSVILLSAEVKRWVLIERKDRKNLIITRPRGWVEGSLKDLLSSI